MILCRYCIEEMRSRGEKIFVRDISFEEETEDLRCEWCDEEDEELYEVIFK